MRSILIALLVASIAVAAYLLVYRDTPSDGVASSPTVVPAPAVDLAPPPDVERAAPDVGRPPPPAPPSPAAERDTTILRVVVAMLGDQRRVPGCDVRFQWADVKDGPVAPVDGGGGTTDPRGEVELVVPVDVFVAILADGDPESSPPYASAREVIPPIARGEARTVTLLVSPPHEQIFFGRVIAAADGAPVANADIRRRGREETVTTTDLDGIFTLPIEEGRIPTAIRLHRIDALGFGPALFQAAAGHERRDLALDLELRPAGGITVATPPASEDAPPRSIVVSAIVHTVLQPDEAFATGSDLEWTAAIDATGHGVRSGLPSRVPLAVSIRSGREVVHRFPGDVVLDDGEQRELRWAPAEATTVIATLIDQYGQPVRGIRVGAFASVRSRAPSIGSIAFVSRDDTAIDRGVTDEQGTVEFRLDAGDYWIGPTPARSRKVDEDSVSPTAHALTVPAAIAPVRVELAAWRGLSIRGTIVTPSGKPPRHGVVAAHMPDQPVNLHAETDKQGRFTLGPLPPGTFIVRAMDQSDHVSSEPTTARAGDSGLRLRVRAGASLSGRVTERDTGRPRQASMIYSSADGELMMNSTREDGSFFIGGLAPGTWSVTATTADGRVGSRNDIIVESGTGKKGVDVHLVPGARLAVAYDGPSLYAQLRVDAAGACVKADGIRSGTEVVCVVPAGPLRVTLHDLERREQTEVHVATGERRSVRFDWRSPR